MTNTNLKQDARDKKMSSKAKKLLLTCLLLGLSVMASVTVGLAISWLLTGLGALVTATLIILLMAHIIREATWRTDLLLVSTFIVILLLANTFANTICNVFDTALLRCDATSIGRVILIYALLGGLSTAGMWIYARITSRSEN
jgi:hypothetical protein